MSSGVCLCVKRTPRGEIVCPSDEQGFEGERGWVRVDVRAQVSPIFGCRSREFYDRL